MVNEQLNSCADDLQQLALRKRIVRTICSPVFLERDPGVGVDEKTFVNQLTAEIGKKVASLNDRMTALPSLMSQEQERIDSSWSSGKLHIVPGDELLDAVCKSFGVRFRKRRDGARLAHLLESRELPDEILNLLNSFVA
jgi:hypothetical protein